LSEADPLPEFSEPPALPVAARRAMESREAEPDGAGEPPATRVTGLDDLPAPVVAQQRLL